MTLITLLIGVSEIYRLMIVVRVISRFIILSICLRSLWSSIRLDRR